MYNLIQNYFFRFLLYGVLYLVFILPSLQLLFACLLFVLTLLSPALTLLYLILAKMFQIIFYDYFNYKNADKLSALPLLNIAIQSGLGAIQVAFSLFMVVYDLLRIIIHFILAIVRFIILHVYGFFTYNIIVKLLGRVPVSESALAYRVGGPGVGKTKFFYSMSKDDIALLVRAKMEEIQINNYREYVQKQIQKPRIDAEELLKNILQQPYDFYKANWIDFQQLIKKEQRLIQDLDTQIAKRQKCFPKIQKLQNVRFKQSELDEFLKISEEIVSIFVDKSTSPEMLTQITKNIWKKIFQNNDIVKPLEINAWQFQLQQDVRNLKSYKKIVKANLSQGISKQGVYGGSLISAKDLGYDEDESIIDASAYANQSEENCSIPRYIGYDVLLSNLKTSVQSAYTPNVIYFINFTKFINIMRKEREEEKRKKEQDAEKQKQ